MVKAFGVIIVGKSDFIYLIHFISGLQVLYRFPCHCGHSSPISGHRSYTCTLMHSRGKRWQGPEDGVFCVPSRTSASRIYLGRWRSLYQVQSLLDSTNSLQLPNCPVTRNLASHSRSRSNACIQTDSITTGYMRQRQRTRK